MKKRVLIVLLCFVGALSSAFAAEKKVQGVVISSEDNLPLIGGWSVLYRYTCGDNPFLL